MFMTVNTQHKRPRLLLSNDDGVGAPGLQALAAAIVAADFCDLLGAHRELSLLSPFDAQLPCTCTLAIANHKPDVSADTL